MRPYLLFPLAAYLIHAVLVYLALRLAPRRALARVFVLFLVSMAFWGLTIYGMRSSPNLQMAHVWERWVFTWLAAAPVFYLHFTYLYVGVQPRSYVLAAWYGLLAFFVVAAHTGLVAPAMVRQSYGYAPVLGPLFAPYVAFIYAAIILGVVNLARAYRRLVGAERNRTAYLIAGAIASIAGGTSDYLAAIGLPIYPLGIFSNIIFGLLSTVAILKHQLLDISLVMRRGTAYVVTATGAALVFLLVSLVAAAVVDVAFGARQRALLTVQVLTGISLMIVFQPVVRWVHGQTDRIFFRERWVPIRELEAFARETRDVTDLPSLAHKLVDLVAGAMHADRVALLMPAGDQVLTYVSGRAEAVPISVAWDSPILAHLARRESTPVQDVEATPHWQGLVTHERTALKLLDGQLFVPLRSKGALIALLVLGPKAGHRPYSQEDAVLLEAVSYQAAAVLENARLYDQLRQKLAELQRAQDQVVRTAKLAAIGELAAAVAHEVNNPLQTILNLTYLLTTDPASQPLRADLKLVEEEVLRARNIVQGLLEFARKGNLRWGMEDVNSGVQAVVNLAQVRVRDGNIRVVADLDPSLPRIWADGEQLRQVFMNLISNAIDAMPNGGSLTIATRTEGDRLLVQFTDTGTGIPPDILPRIFEPFFTTKDPGKGTGLGLAVSASIIERHGGSITVTSTPGKGTTFTISLPLTPAEQKVVSSHG